MDVKLTKALRLAAVAAVSLVMLASLLLLSSCLAPSVSRESASHMSYDPAFTQSYVAAQEAVSLKAEDAKLLAIQSDDFTLPGSKTSWVYLFYSWDRSSAYTVTVANGSAKVTDNPGMSLAKTNFEAIPDISDSAFDADAAYRAVTEQLDGTGKLITCRAYIVSYAGESESATMPPCTWVFSFNQAEDVREAALDKTGEISPQRVFAVDAYSCEVSEIAAA